MALIEYIGRKPKKEDNVAGTGVLWVGPGDVQEVADPTAVRKLLAYDTVWRRAPDPGLEAAPSPAPSPAANASKYVLQGPDGDVVLDTMKDKELRAFVKDKLEPAGVGKDIDLRLGGDKLRGAIVDAVKAAASVVGTEG